MLSHQRRYDMRLPPPERERSCDCCDPVDGTLPCPLCDAAGSPDGMSRCRACRGEGVVVCCEARGRACANCEICAAGVVLAGDERDESEAAE